MDHGAHDEGSSHTAGRMGQTPSVIVLEAGSARLDIAPEHGGRVAQLSVGGRELLVGYSDGAGAMGWGSFPMVPYVGRIRRGHLDFEGIRYELPVTLAPHAIHGTTYLVPWEVTGPASIRCDLGEDWPFGGWAEQHFELADDHVTMTLSVHAAEQAMPAQVGWHPWFVKPEQLEFTADAMLLRDGDGIADGTRVAVPPPPWDDAFVGVHQPVRLHWTGLTLEITSDGDDWVVYDMPEHATCVEPQSGPPDGSNWAPVVLRPHGSLSRTMTWRWSATES